MIPTQNIVAWGNVVPWADQRQVEQDLIIGRALVEIFSDDMLRDAVRVRGGTALNKLHFPKPMRYSEDIDLVRTTGGPIGPILDQVRVVLEPWLGRARFDQSPVAPKFRFRVDAEDGSGVPIRLKVAAIATRQWKSLLDPVGGHEAMGHIEAMLGVDLSDEGQRFEARDVIAPVVARWVGARGYDDVRAAFDAAGVCWGPYQSFLEMVRDDPRCSTRNPLFEEVDQPGIGRFMMPGSPLEFRRHEREEIRPAPMLGQHTDEILAEVLGLTGARIGELHDGGIVA